MFLVAKSRIDLFTKHELMIYNPQIKGNLSGIMISWHQYQGSNKPHHIWIEARTFSALKVTW